MKKIGLITYHKSFNYGAMLQVYATQYIVNKLGHECKIIDYVNKSEERENSLFCFRSEQTLIMNFKNFVRNILLQSYFIRKNNFKKFINKLERTKEVSTCEEISELNFDTYLVGSDQVWNPAITGNKFENVFLLDFPAKRKISYASSMGSHLLTPEEQQIVKKTIGKFNAVSVREQFAQEQLKKLNIEAEEVCDPTLLISKEDWIRDCSDDSVLNKIPKKYIVVYILEPFNERISNILISLKQKYNLPIVYIAFSTSRKKGVDYHLTDVTPERFISLINGAEIVITDSFHGTAFSVNFNKEFISLLNPHNPKRVENFLEKLGLKDNIYTENNSDNKKTDYKEINKKIEDIRKKSTLYLEKNL